MAKSGRTSLPVIWSSDTGKAENIVETSFGQTVSISGDHKVTNKSRRQRLTASSHYSVGINWVRQAEGERLPLLHGSSFLANLTVEKELWSCRVGMTMRLSNAWTLNRIMPTESEVGYTLCVECSCIIPFSAPFSRTWLVSDFWFLNQIKSFCQL